MSQTKTQLVEGLNINTSAPADALAVDNSGRVGIGTTSPGSPLTIVATTGQPILNASVSTGTNGCYSQFSNTAGALIVGRDNSSGGILGGGAYASHIYSQGAYPLVFSTDSTLRAQIDSSGRLLVGTSSTSADSRLLVQGNSNGSASIVVLSSTSNSPVDGQALAALRFADSGHVASAAITAFRDGGTWTSGSSQPTRLEFSTTADGASSRTEHMRITEKGMFKVSNSGSYLSATSTAHEIVNTTGSQNIIQFVNASTQPFGNYIFFNNAAPDNNDKYFLRCDDNTGGSTARLFIYSDGDVWTSDAGTLTSDETLKRDITDASPKLADVMNLRVRNFYWREDYHPNKQDKKLIGFVAQEFEEVFPGLVSDHKIRGGDPVLDEDGNKTGETTPEVYKKGIKEGKLIPILVKALQEAVERIETLEQRLSDAGIA